MIIYSVTITLDLAIENEWRQWMEGVHIPDVMKSGYFSESHFHQLLVPEPEAGVVTYNVQYVCANMADYETYQEKAAPALQKDHNDRFKGRFVAFRTLLQRHSSH